MPTQWHRDIGGLGPAGLRRPELAGPQSCSHLKARCLPVCCVRASALARAAGERAAWPHSSWPPRPSGLAGEIRPIPRHSNREVACPARDDGSASMGHLALYVPYGDQQASIQRCSFNEVWFNSQTVRGGYYKWL